MRNEEGGNSVSTVVLRASTESILDDLERAILHRFLNFSSSERALIRSYQRYAPEKMLATRKMKCWKIRIGFHFSRG